MDVGGSVVPHPELDVDGPQGLQVGVDIAAHIRMVLACCANSGAAPLVGRWRVEWAAPRAHFRSWLAGTMSSMVTSTGVGTNDATAVRTFSAVSSTGVP